MALSMSISRINHEFTNHLEEDEEYICLPIQESRKQDKCKDEEDEELVFSFRHGLLKQDMEDETKDDQQVLCEVLCADRVGQMTKTYSDIDAVTRLLEEKERDLELAARIGQSLLKKNKALSDRNELLEDQVEHIREEVSQLRHDLSMKDELLQFYTNAAEESEGESNTTTPVRPIEPNVSTPTFFPLDLLQKKLKDLEEENKSLRSAANHLETETISYEEKEQQLVNDCVKELRDANLQMSSLAEELAKKTEDASRQQEEITHLLSQIVDLQKKAKIYAVENEELSQHLGAAKDAQRQLTAELQELHDKYVECIEMLHEAQEELKNLRNKALPLTTTRRFHSLGLFPMDSLAAEIEGTMRKELQMDDPDVEEQRLHPKRVFQTVKNLNLMRQQRSPLAQSPLNIPGSNQTSCFTSGRSSRSATPCSNSVPGSAVGSGIILDNRTSSILGGSDDGSEDSNKHPTGTPGNRDLEAALHRLSLRRDNYLSEKCFFEEEKERKLAYLAKEEEKGGGEGSGGPGTPTESLLSLYSQPSIGSFWSGYSITARSYLPEKLQIVKPLEGSATLHAWQQLAQPHMGALLDHRPGVVTKGFRTLEHEQEHEESWQLDQPEEDDLSCDLFTGSTPAVTNISTSKASVCRRKTDGLVGPRQSEGLNGAIFDTSEAREESDVGRKQLPLPGSSPSSPVGSGSEISRHIELHSMQAASVDNLPVHFPGKCMSHTSSTYTFTTCRILHPSDQLTSVSPSPVIAACLRSSVTGSSTHTPPPVPSTPSCMSHRPSLSLSLTESSTNLRDSTKTTSTSLGLAHLLLECGISASVYNPHSWDRGLGAFGASHIVSRAQAKMGAARAPDSSAGQLMKRPDTLLLQSPTQPSLSKSVGPTDADPAFHFSPSKEDPPFFDAFLASKPARTILREVLMDLERERSDQMDEDAPNEMMNLRLVDKLKRFRTFSPISSLVSSGSTLLAPFESSGLAGGISGLNPGLRRNQSYPAMVGASMAMKDPGGPRCSVIPQTVKRANVQDAEKTEETGKEHRPPRVVRKALHVPQTLHVLETVTPHRIIQRHTRPKADSQDPSRPNQQSKNQHGEVSPGIGRKTPQ